MHSSPLLLFGFLSGAAVAHFSQGAARARRETSVARMDAGQILDSLEEGIVTLGRDYRILEANRAYREMTGGGSGASVEGKRCFEVSHGLDRPCHQEGERCPVRKVFESGEPETFIHTHPGRDGRLDGVALAAYPLKDATGEVVRVMEVVRNLTQEQLADQRLKESEERYRDLFQHSNDAIIIHDMEGRIVDVNQRAVDMLGYAREELQAIVVPDLHPQESSAESQWAFATIEKVGFVSFEIEFRRKNGSVFPTEVSASLLTIGEEKFVQGIVRDITLRKAQEEIARQYAEKLEYMNSVKDLFADILCHDLLNPASTVAGMSALLGRRDHPRDAKEIAAIQRNAERIIQLIKDASTYARIEGESSLRKEENDLVAIIATCMEALRPKAEEKEIAVTLDHEGDAPVMTNWMMGEVFDNLLSNAVKYSPAGSRVKVSVRRESGGQTVAVADRGEGVPDEYKKTIFERFSRGEKRGVKGTGLGLAIAARVMDFHGGRVWVEDNPGGGSIFFVTLPT
jgi:PAS domain S-box-containing protein